jgi:uncharacterized lipoprotein NlpE involved in copper resistance
MVQRLIIIILIGVLFLVGCQNRTQVHDQIDTEELTGFGEFEEFFEAGGEAAGGVGGE